MTPEDKDLLLQDLCARLPYGVIVNVNGFDYDYNDKLTQIYKGVGCSIQVTTNMPYDIEQVKPYLFPLSSMTEEQCDELYNISELKLSFTPDRKINVYKETVEWFLKNHIDFNGLIPKGLAIDCTNLNIYLV